MKEFIFNNMQLSKLMGTYKCDLKQNSTMNLGTHHATTNLFLLFYLLRHSFLLSPLPCFWTILKQILGTIIVINTSANEY